MAASSQAKTCVTARVNSGHQQQEQYSVRLQILNSLVEVGQGDFEHLTVAGVVSGR
jgi:hypothetical protein